jgi:DNA-binding Lrp family transcriptional regulator
MALDKKDWKILATLSKDCRTSLTQIAKAVGVSREVADYRIKKLVKTGMIKSFCTEVNLQALGYTKHVVYLELKNVDKEKEENVFKQLRNHKFISWIVTSTGKWSIIFDIHTKNTQHLSKIIKELKQELGNYFGEYEIVTLENYQYFHSKFFGEKDTVPKKKTKELSLDDTDLSLLKILRNNARIDYVKLSKDIKLTPEAISKRIKKLKDNNIIKQFYIFPDLTKLGFEHYNIQINLENIGNEKEEKILNYLQNHKSVSFIYKPISHWDIEFGVFVNNPGELRDFMLQLRTLHPENIRIKDVALFYEEILPNFLPEGVF